MIVWVYLSSKKKTKSKSKPKPKTKTETKLSVKGREINESILCRVSSEARARRAMVKSLAGWLQVILTMIN